MQRVLENLEKLFYTIYYGNHEKSIKLDLYDIQYNHYRIQVRTDNTLLFRLNNETVGVSKIGEHTNLHIIHIRDEENNLSYALTALEEFLQKTFKVELTQDSILKIEKVCFEVM